MPTAQTKIRVLHQTLVRKDGQTPLPPTEVVGTSGISVVTAGSQERYDVTCTVIITGRVTDLSDAMVSLFQYLRRTAGDRRVREALERSYYTPGHSVTIGDASK